MNAKLSSFLSFKSAHDLVRVGRDHDGRYLPRKFDMPNFKGAREIDLEL